MAVQAMLPKGDEPGKPNDFESWLGERHRWLQTAAQRLIESKAPPTELELAELSKLCIGEASGTGTHAFATVVPGSLVQAAVRPQLQIRGLSEVRGVNKIKDRASLSFGTSNLTVVYGANGSGKTGFSRVLKQACGSKAKENIHPNVFDKASPACEAKISVSVDNKAFELDWTLADGPLPSLRNVHVFDTKTASNYVASQNEAQYEPSRMRFVSALIKICGKVAEQLAAQKVELVKKLPLFPVAYALTASAKFFQSLRAATSKLDIDKACEYSDAHDKERIAAEGALAQKDIAGRLTAIGKEQVALTQVRTTLSALQDALSDEKLKAFLTARAEATAKRKAASEVAEKVFANAPLEGVGQEIWMALWEQARSFAQAHAYPGHQFPNVDADARCVLCQQILDPEGKTRISQFEAFVIGGLEATAKAAEKIFGELLRKMPVIPQKEGWMLQAAVLKLEDSTADAVFTLLNARSAAALTAAKLEDIPVVDLTVVDEAYSIVSTALTAEVKALQELQGDGKRKQLEARVLELLAMQWLSQNKASIVDEVERLKDVGMLDKAVTLTTTTALTRKHTDLAKDDLHKGYQDRFSAELNYLGGKKLPVKPESKQAGKGKITFGLTLQGVERTLAAELVLSEGETRIVALAAFLADISGMEHRSPFIFDDPISSLDQDFEEKVVKRLIELAKTRQVIVFTHRLSLLALIESEVKKLKEDAELAKLAPAVELQIQSVCSFGKNAGVVQDISIRDLKPKTAINRMSKEQLPQLRKLHDAGEVAAYDERANGLCSDLRILVERCVESVLLNEVLIRFRRSLQTQGRIGALAKITANDCSLIDDLMTRYSVFEHSQSDELPAVRPEIDDIEADVAKLAAWIEEFSKRAVA